MFRIVNIHKTWKASQFLIKKKSTVDCPRMTQMLELSDNGFKVAVTGLFHVVKVNTLEINDKRDMLNRKKYTL